MRRVLLAVFVLALQSASTAQSTPARPQPADAVVRLLDDLEKAIQGGKADALRALASQSLPAADAERLARVISTTPATGAIVRERARRAAGSGFEVLADVLISRGRVGRIATWMLATQPRAASADRYELTAFNEVAALDSLLKLHLDTTKQYTIKNLTLTLTDLSLTMDSGIAFVAESDNGVTAMVLRGKGEVVFSPSDPAEQTQLRLFNGGRAPLATPIDSAFLRLNPGEFAERIPSASLTPSQRIDQNELRRAEEIFADLAPRSYNLDLRELTSDRWYLEPSYGNFVVEFRSSRHGWLTYVRSPNDPDDISLFDRGRNRNISIYASPEKLKTRGRFYTEDTDIAYDVERYNLDLTFDPQRAFISGRGTLHVRIRAQAVGTLTFRLAQQFAVSSVSSPQFGYLLALRVTGQNNLLVSLPRMLERGSELIVEVAYNGRLDPQAVDREALAPEGQVQDPESPMLTPEPRFLYSNRIFWYPQSQVSDYATANLRLSVPAEYQIIASGKLMNSAIAPASGEAGRGPARSIRTVEYSATRPARYLACIISRFEAVGRTKLDVPVSPEGVNPRGSDMTSGVNIEVISTPRVAGRNRQLPARLAEMLKFYATTIGEAPYPDFTVATLDDNLPGGHSPPYFAIWHQPLPTTPYSWTSDPVSFDTMYPQFFVAHEAAHQWWGQAVGWKNYHEQWLSEGLAQYFAALYAGSERGPEFLASLINQMRETAEPMLAQGPIYLGYRLGHVQSEGRVFRALVYNKAAVVLHMLRRLMGDDAFFKGIQAFYRDWRFSKAGTDDFRAIMESQTTLRLSRFFDRWILGSTIPRVRVTPRINPDAKTAVVTIEQVGDVFDFPLTIVVQYADNTTEAITVPVTEATVEHPITLKGVARRIYARDELTFVEIVR